VYVTEPDVVGVTAWEPVAAWLPLQAPLAVQEAARVLDHISVADWPAVIEVGLTDRVTFGIGAGGALDPLPPQAWSDRAMRAAAAAGQGSRIRKLVRIGDMLPRPSGVCVLRRRRPNTIQRGGVPKSMESCGGTLVPRVNSHTARLAPREFYSVATLASSSTTSKPYRYADPSGQNILKVRPQNIEIPITPLAHLAGCAHDAHRLGARPIELLNDYD
jgi:hypothetical protein